MASASSNVCFADFLPPGFDLPRPFWQGICVPKDMEDLLVCTEQGTAARQWEDITKCKIHIYRVLTLEGLTEKKVTTLAKLVGVIAAVHAAHKRDAACLSDEELFNHLIWSRPPECPIIYQAVFDWVTKVGNDKQHPYHRDVMSLGARRGFLQHLEDRGDILSSL